jgi:hypothetical protein
MAGFPAEDYHLQPANSQRLQDGVPKTVNLKVEKRIHGTRNISYH